MDNSSATLATHCMTTCCSDCYLVNELIFIPSSCYSNNLNIAEWSWFILISQSTVV